MNLLKSIEQQKQFISNVIGATGGASAIKENDPLFEIVRGFTVMRSKAHLWDERGQKTFVLSKELVEAFRHTDIPMSLTPEDFNYPFDVFMVEGNVPLFQTDLNGIKRDVYSIMFIHQEALKTGTEFIDDDGKKVKRPEWQIALTGFFMNDERYIENLMINLQGGVSLGKSAARKKTGKFMFDLDEEDIKSMVNLFFNTVLYINDPSREKAETEERKVRSMKNPGTGKFKKSEYIVLKPPKGYVSFSKGDGTTLDKRFIVRGHWRNQRHGEGMTQTKKIWIRPHWKGPDLSEVVKKKYSVK